MGLKASTKGGDSKKIDNVELIQPGFQLCTLYGMADIGTQDTGNFGPRHKLNLAFEFPQNMRVFYEGDDPKPACIFQDETLSMHEKSNLRTRFIEPMVGRKMTDAQAEDFEISSLLGKHFIATIAHSPDGNWANIQSLIPLTEQNKNAVNLPSAIVEQINPTYYFDMDLGYQSTNFATLPKFVREKIMGSTEAKAHQMAGGKFAEHINVHETGTVATNATVAPPSVSGKLQMIDTSATYEAFIASGWTDALLIEHGKAKILAPVAPPAPITSATPPPPPGGAIAPPPVAAKPVLVLKDPSATVKDWIDAGWTEQQIVDAGHGSFQ